MSAHDPQDRALDAADQPLEPTADPIGTTAASGRPDASAAPASVDADRAAAVPQGGGATARTSVADVAEAAGTGARERVTVSDTGTFETVETTTDTGTITKVSRRRVRPADEAALLEVRNLVRHFPISEIQGLKRVKSTVLAVDDISFDLAKGESLGLVGESGCGKSTTARMLTRLDAPTSGSIKFEGKEIGNLPERQLRPLRREVQMIFQDPYSSLNPRQTVGSILSTPLKVHGLHKGKEIERVRELLELVGLNPEHINRYPSEFSGGQRQRIGIARALAVEPKVIIADEPVSALDVSVQAQVMNLLAKLRDELDLSFVFVAHDLGVIRHFCDRVAVMYLGKIVEIGNKQEIYGAPQHPYTQALLSAAPDINVVKGAPPKERIRLAGDPPSPIDPPSGCRFRTRCWKAQDICASQEPPLERKDDVPGHTIACHFPEKKTQLTASL